MHYTRFNSIYTSINLHIFLYVSIMESYSRTFKKADICIYSHVCVRFGYIWHIVILYLYLFMYADEIKEETRHVKEKKKMTKTWIKIKKQISILYDGWEVEHFVIILLKFAQNKARINFKCHHHPPNHNNFHPAIQLP